MEGYVYVLSNASMPGIYKIGFTSKPVKERISELSRSTGVPIPFKEEYSCYVFNMREAESQLHEVFDEYRINQNREFFKVDLEIIKTAISCLYVAHKRMIDKYCQTIYKTGEAYYKKHHRDMLNQLKLDIVLNDFDFEWFADIFYKDGIYYRAECYSPVCTKEEFESWKNDCIKANHLIKFKNKYIMITRLNRKCRKVKTIAA